MQAISGEYKLRPCWTGFWIEGRYNRYMLSSPMHVPTVDGQTNVVCKRFEGHNGVSIVSIVKPGDSPPSQGLKSSCSKEQWPSMILEAQWYPFAARASQTLIAAGGVAHFIPRFREFEPTRALLSAVDCVD